VIRKQGAGRKKQEVRRRMQEELLPVFPGVMKLVDFNK
jgi:hypothetical protein